MFVVVGYVRKMTAKEKYGKYGWFEGIIVMININH